MILGVGQFKQLSSKDLNLLLQIPDSQPSYSRPSLPGIGQSLLGTSLVTGKWANWGMLVTLASTGWGGRPGHLSLDSGVFLPTHARYHALWWHRGWENPSTAHPHRFHHVHSCWQNTWYSTSLVHLHSSIYCASSSYFLFNGSSTPIFSWWRAGASPPPPYSCPGIYPPTMADGDQEVLQTLQVSLVATRTLQLNLCWKTVLNAYTYLLITKITKMG